MSAPKLNPSAVAALTMLRDHNDKCTAKGVPEAYWSTFEPSYMSDTWKGFSPATLRALVRKGLAEFHPDYVRSYWTRITEKGREALK